MERNRRKNMYKRDRRKGVALFIAAGTAITVCVALIGFMVWILVLRTEYRAFCMEINKAVLDARGTQMTVERGDETWPMDEQLLDYYNRNLLAEKTIVFSRRGAEPNAKTIHLHFSGTTLSLTGLEDGSRIAVSWKTSDGERSYSIRSTSVSFMQYSAYLSNYVRKLQSGG